MDQIVSCDIGGTHARFALAMIRDSRAIELGEPLVLKTDDFADFRQAWNEFGRHVGRPVPTNLAIAFAGPVDGEVLKLTNNPWLIRPSSMHDELGVERFTVVNDFGAIAHAVATLGETHFQHLRGSEGALPERGIVTIVGPGTGLGVAALLRGAEGHYDVIETEGGHIDFAPLDSLEDSIVRELRKNFRRVSVERIVSGRGLRNLYDALAIIEDRPSHIHDDPALWAAAIDGSDDLAATALDRFCLSLGAVAGDLALAQGAAAVVIAGGVGHRLAGRLPASGFGDRFIAKGRFERRMAAMPVKLITHPHPGLHGAAAAFAREHR